MSKIKLNNLVKRITLKSTLVAMLFCAASAVGYDAYTNKYTANALTYESIESITACENDGGKNNGHCVFNSANVSFCAETLWYQSDDCVQ